MSQIETWVREIHEDVRELRGEMGDLRKDIADSKTLEQRVQQLEHRNDKAQQTRLAFTAPLLATIIGAAIAVAPHFP